jgi:hypothetical protein
MIEIFRWEAADDIAMLLLVNTLEDSARVVRLAPDIGRK